MKRSCPKQFTARIRPADAVRVGLFLGWRQLVRAGKGTTALIVFIMTLTFLNLTMVSGILLGLVEGSSQAYREHYSADLIISEVENKRFISHSQEIVSFLRGQPEITAVSPRYLQTGRVIANWQEQRSVKDLPDSVGAVIAGIDPDSERQTTDLADKLVAGRYLDRRSFGEVLLGASLLSEYSRGLQDETLGPVKIGGKVRLVINEQTREVTVRGVVKSKIGEVDRRVFMLDRELRQQIGRDDLNVNEIAVKLQPGSQAAAAIAGRLKAKGYDEYGQIQTWEEAQGSFFQDLQRTFSILSNFIGSIALAVAAITVFIVILINALARKKEIGIMKGIGVCGRAITLAYVLQALAYAAVGTMFGLALLFGLVKPFFDANPIDFPFSDGILVATASGTAWRVLALFVATALAGWLPARSIIRQNTLKTILGR